MTFAEFAAFDEAQQKRIDDERYLVAWEVAHLLQPYLKKGRKITPEKLLGLKPKRKGQPREPRDPIKVDDWAP